MAIPYSFLSHHFFAIEVHIEKQLLLRPLVEVEFGRVERFKDLDSR